MIIPQCETVKPGDIFQVSCRVQNLWRRYVQIKRGHFSRQMGLAGSGSVVGKMNAHIRLRLPDRAQAQHLLGCVCARLCEQLEPKALTTHYAADKPVCVRKVSQKPWLLPPRLGCCRSAFLLNTEEPRVTTPTCMWNNMAHVLVSFQFLVFLITYPILPRYMSQDICIDVDFHALYLVVAI